MAKFRIRVLKAMQRRARYGRPHRRRRRHEPGDKVRRKAAAILAQQAKEWAAIARGAKEYLAAELRDGGEDARAEIGFGTTTADVGRELTRQAMVMEDAGRRLERESRGELQGLADEIIAKAWKVYPNGLRGRR